MGDGIDTTRRAQSGGEGESEVNIVDNYLKM